MTNTLAPTSETGGLDSGRGVLGPGGGVTTSNPPGEGGGPGLLLAHNTAPITTIAKIAIPPIMTGLNINWIPLCVVDEEDVGS